jgi:ComF family protein
MVYKWIDFIHSRLSGHCLLCGDRCPAGDGLSLCSGCRCDLPPNSHPCPACGEPLAGPDMLCGNCQRRPPPCDTTIAPLLYAPPLDTLILRMKAPAGIVAACTLGRLLAWQLESRAVERPDLLLPIPLHPTRLRERGFNQAALLARQISRKLDIPWDAGILEKCRQTEDQRGLDRRARQRNLRGSFVSRELPRGCHVAIVDDVITTGATSQEAARTLKRAGAGRVDVWALARTP